VTLSHFGGRIVKTLVRGLFVFCAAALLAATASAEDKKVEKKPAKPKAEPFAHLFSFPKQIKLDEKQQTQLADLKKEYTPKLVEIHARLDKIMTPERKKTADTARKEAKAAGKKGKEIGEAVDAALKLSDSEKAELKASNKEHSKLVKEIREKKTALLTAEQKALLKPKKPKKEN
jgi:hypothetical protein